MPDPKSIHSRPSTSVIVAPPALLTYDGIVLLTPRATAAVRRWCNSADVGISNSFHL
jgi:hypothetical protein